MAEITHRLVTTNRRAIHRCDRFVNLRNLREVQSPRADKRTKAIDIQLPIDSNVLMNQN